MKTQNVLKNLLLCAALTAAPIFSSFAGEGGLSGGGGGTYRNKPADLTDVRLAIAQLRASSDTLIERFFSANETTTNSVSVHNYPIYRDLVKALGENKLSERARKANANVKVKIVDGTCANQKIGEVAVTSREINEICYSTSSILKRLHSKGELDRKLVALHMHEILHVLGLNRDHENLAKKFQFFVESYLPNNFSQDGLRRARVMAKYKMGTYEILHWWGVVTTSSFQSACVEIANSLGEIDFEALTNPVRSYWSNSNYTDYSSVFYLSHRARFKISQAYAQLILANCSEGRSADAIRNVFSGREQMPLKEFLEKRSLDLPEEYANLEMLNINIKNPTYGNVKMFRELIEAITEHIYSTRDEIIDDNNWQDLWWRQ